MNAYLSIDTEATGLREGNYLTQLAMVPLDTARGKVFTELGREWLVQCPSYEELEPKLDEWNRKHNKTLIQQAHKEGVVPGELPILVNQYLTSPEVKAIFGEKRPVILGKSLSALDIPILKRYLGWDLYEKLFHHHTLDVTCLTRGLVDAGLLPPGCESTTKLVQHYGIREESTHTALNDALDMANIYLKIIESLKKKP